MKKIILSILIIALISLTGCTKKKDFVSSYDKIIEKDILIIGVREDARPFGYISSQSKERKGFDIDLARLIAKDILDSERKIEFVSVDVNTRLEAVTSGQVDMVIATMSITPQRQYFVDFTIPYYIAGQTAIVRKNSKINSFFDLKDKEINIVLGTTAEKNIRKLFPTAKLIGHKTYKDAYESFKNGVGDAFSTDNTILAGLIDDEDYEDFKILQKKISQEPYAIAIKRNEDVEDLKLKKNLNIIINRLRNDGTLKELEEKWL